MRLISPNTTTPKILVVRPDRIGDVVLSTPVVSALRRQYPTAEITFMVRELVAPLVRGMDGVTDVFVYDPDGRHKGIGGFFRLMEELKRKNFHIAIVLHSTPKVAAAIYGIGIPNRIGPLSKPHSFLFYNRGSRQGRSRVEMHEADYNLQLLRRLGIRAGTHTVRTGVHIDEGKRAWARQWLAERGFRTDDPEREGGHRKLVAVHPGMGGSALNWPENYYVELIRALKREGHEVLVTGGPSEATLLGRLQEEIRKNQPDKAQPEVLFYGGPGAGVIDSLAALFSQADVVVAPSTGPLHVAVALGKPVVTFFPPVRVMSAIRWGPYVTKDEEASVLVPEVYCGQDFKCLGPKCNYYPCMRTLTPHQALEEVLKQLARSSSPKAKTAGAAVGATQEGTTLA